MIIAVDHGNKQIKTEHFIFASGFAEDDNRPFGQEVLKYQDKYYLLSGKRFPYMKDKTKDTRFFILTLFAIAKELKRAKDAGGLRDGVVLIQLAVGLPPKHFSSLYIDFQKYFLGNASTPLEFEYNGEVYSISITNVVAFPQTLAAVMRQDELVSQIAKIYVIDLGGYTLDYLELSYGEPDISSCASLDSGIISFYNLTIQEVDSRFDVLLSEKDIDSIINKDKSVSLPEGVRDFVESQAVAFVADIINTLRERHIDLRSAKSIWMGGGAFLLKHFIEDNPRVGEIDFIEDIRANALGYKMLYEISVTE